MMEDGKTLKAEEIFLWLKEHEEAGQWVVLEDHDLKNEEISRHQIRINPEMGLPAEDVESAVKCLNFSENQVIL